MPASTLLRKGGACAFTESLQYKDSARTRLSVRGPSSRWHRHLPSSSTNGQAHGDYPPLTLLACSCRYACASGVIEGARLYYCLQTYARLAGLSVSTSSIDNPKASPTLRLPMLEAGDRFTGDVLPSIRALSEQAPAPPFLHVHTFSLMVVITCRVIILITG